MLQFPRDIKFKYQWRKYQQRVLDELQEHLADQHLHIIAPPGSGKTILGLEVAIRINKPSLILAPSLAIRNQWIQRFCELFLQTDKTPEWISLDIRNPMFLTVVTYQGLHAACNNKPVIEEEDEEESEDLSNEKEKIKISDLNLNKIVAGLKKQKIGTIVIDEAHHLKNEWWQTLIKVKEGLTPVIIGLTATPPYDVSFSEWERYQELNGPVDAEISVPELIIEGDLCPHQDYVYFSRPLGSESEKIAEFREAILDIFNEIKTDRILLEAIESHYAYQKPNENLDWIYSNLSFYSASIIYLNAVGLKIDKNNLKLIGDKNLKIPILDYQWTEILLDFYLYQEKQHFKNYAEHQKSLEAKLRRHGAIEKKKINLIYNKTLTGFLSSSIGKLNSVKEIVDFEFRQLGKGLRMVILTDFIRKEFFLYNSNYNDELNKIGVVPIFEILRRNNTNNKKLGILTGSLIVIPKSALIALQQAAINLGIDYVNYSSLPTDNEYLILNQSEQLKHDIVHIVTQIFQHGEIEILIGTKSLLGEGWDAPAINSLILASFVGSFVMSNQMRGRAIRTQKENPDKTGNIWHLACLDPTSSDGGHDVQLLRRRFKGFVGVTFKEEPAIENGSGRLNIPLYIEGKEEMEVINANTFLLASKRELLKDKWHAALAKGVSLVEEIKIPFPDERGFKKTKRMYYYKTIGYLIAQLSSGVALFVAFILKVFGKSIKHIHTFEDFYRIISLIGGSGLLIFGWKLYKTFSLYINYRDISKDIHHIGEALLNTLIKAEIIHTENSKLKVVSKVDDNGAIYCHLEGSTTLEKSNFINTLKEVIGPVESPKYVIVRKSKFAFIQQRDYHTVPEIIGRNKKLAEYFRFTWETFVGSCDLIFTRTIEGRKLLLKSRAKSLASKFEKEIEHINTWK